MIPGPLLVILDEMYPSGVPDPGPSTNAGKSLESLLEYAFLVVIPERYY